MGLAEIVKRLAVSSAIAVSLSSALQPASVSARADQEALEAMCTKDPSVVVVLKETLTPQGRDFKPYGKRIQLYDESGSPTCLAGLAAGTHMLAGAAANVKGGRSYFILTDPNTSQPVFRASANAPMRHALSFRDPKAGIDYIVAALEIESVDAERRNFSYFAISLFALDNGELALVGYHPLDTPRFRNLGPLRSTGLGYVLTQQGPVVLIGTEQWRTGRNDKPYGASDTIRIRVGDLEGVNNTPVVESLENTWEPLGWKTPWVIEKLDSGQGKGAQHAMPVQQQLNPHQFTKNGYLRGLFIK